MSGNNGVATVTALSSGRAQTGVASAASGPLGSAAGGGNDPHPLIGYVTGTQQQQHQQVWPLTQFFSFVKIINPPRGVLFFRSFGDSLASVLDH